MRFCFLINPTQDWQQAVEHTFQLAKQAHIDHELAGVFFYGTAVKIAQNTDYQTQWHTLADCPLYVCRTMIEEHHLSEQDIKPPFNVIGMAPWIMTMEQADRIVEII